MSWERRVQCHARMPAIHYTVYSYRRISRKGNEVEINYGRCRGGDSEWIAISEILLYIIRERSSAAAGLIMCKTVLWLLFSSIRESQPAKIAP